MIPVCFAQFPTCSCTWSIKSVVTYVISARNRYPSNRVPVSIPITPVPCRYPGTRVSLNTRVIFPKVRDTLFLSDNLNTTARAVNALHLHHKAGLQGWVPFIALALLCVPAMSKWSVRFHLKSRCGDARRQTSRMSDARCGHKSDQVATLNCRLGDKETRSGSAVSSEWVSSFLTAHQHIIGHFSAIAWYIYVTWYPADNYSFTTFTERWQPRTYFFTCLKRRGGGNDWKERERGRGASPPPVFWPRIASSLMSYLSLLQQPKRRRITEFVAWRRVERSSCGRRLRRLQRASATPTDRKTRTPSSWRPLANRTATTTNR